MPTEEYEPLSQELISKVTRYVDNKCGWALMRNQEGVIVYQKRSKDFPGMMFKSEGMVNASPELIYKYIETAPESLRLEWDKRVAGIATLETINANLAIMRTHTTAELAGIITARDFVDLITSVKNDDYLANFAVSVAGPNYPEQENFVRGFNHPSGIFCYYVKGEPDQTNVVCLLQPDVRGKVPSELVDAVMPSSCEDFYRYLRVHVAKKNKA